MKINRIVIIIAFAVSLLASPAGAQTVIDRIVAIVGKEIITLSDLNLTIQSMALQNRIDPNQPGLRDKVLDGMINEKLILAQAILEDLRQRRVLATPDLDGGLSGLPLGCRVLYRF